MSVRLARQLPAKQLLARHLLARHLLVSHLRSHLRWGKWPRAGHELSQRCPGEAWEIPAPGDPPSSSGDLEIVASFIFGRKQGKQIILSGDPREIRNYLSLIFGRK